MKQILFVIALATFSSFGAAQAVPKEATVYVSLSEVLATPEELLLEIEYRPEPWLDDPYYYEIK